MVSKLVLVRHAKTQTRSLELADRDRQLTRAGRRSVEARFPVTLRLVEDVSAADLKVWSSPAPRALQTAEVVARVLGIDGIERSRSRSTPRMPSASRPNSSRSRDASSPWGTIRSWRSYADGLMAWCSP